MNNIQILEKFTLPRNFRGKNAITVQLWWLVQSTLFSWSPQIMYGWRRWLLRIFGAEIGKQVIIRPSARITYPWKVKIGDYSWIGDDVNLYSLGEIKIGSNSVISQKSYLCSAAHNYKKIDFPIYSMPIIIGDQVWLATDVFVAPGITIAEGTVVGARSSVLHDLPPMMVCYGNPAKPIKKRIPSQN